eukprot:15434386-Alexandrium_andersonii.AAC.1
MDKAVVPTGPTGRNVLFQGLGSAENGDPEVSALRAGGAALRAAPPAPRAATEVVADFCRSQAPDKD